MRKPTRKVKAKVEVGGNLDQGRGHVEREEDSRSERSDQLDLGNDYLWKEKSEEISGFQTGLKRAQCSGLPWRPGGCSSGPQAGAGGRDSSSPPLPQIRKL